MKSLNLITLAVLNMFLITAKSCDYTPNNTKQNERPKSFEVSYSLDHDWIGYYFVVTINQDGNLTVSERSFPEINKNSSYRLNDVELNEIQVSLIKLTNVNLEALYTIEKEGIHVMDLPINTLKYNVDGESGKTKIYGNGVGNELRELIDKINKICTKYYGKHP